MSARVCVDNIEGYEYSLSPEGRLLRRRKDIDVTVHEAFVRALAYTRPLFQVFTMA